MPPPPPDRDCSISMKRAELIFGSDRALIFAAFGRDDLLALFLPDTGEAVGDDGDLLLLGEPRLPRALLDPNWE